MPLIIRCDHAVEFSGVCKACQHNRPIMIATWQRRGGGSGYRYRTICPKQRSEHYGKPMLILRLSDVDLEKRSKTKGCPSRAGHRIEVPPRDKNSVSVSCNKNNGGMVCGTCSLSKHIPQSAWNNMLKHSGDPNSYSYRCSRIGRTAGVVVITRVDVNCVSIW